MNKNKLIELIDSNGRFNLPTTELEQFADYLIANGIGDITAEKHRADVAEEALRLACNDVRHNYYMTGTEALIDNYKQQAEQYGKEEV